MPVPVSVSPGNELEPQAPPSAPAPDELSVSHEQVAVTVVFEPHLPLPDMKARLVLNRLGARGRVLKTHPPADQLDEVESLSEFTVWLAAECEPDELRVLADVDGVARIRIEPVAATQPQSRTEESRHGVDQERTPVVVNEPADHETAAPGDAEAVEPPMIPPVEASPFLLDPHTAAPAATQASGPPHHRPSRVEESPGRRRWPRRFASRVDRLDYLMNLAGELVINKARFVNIAKGLEELFRGSNAQALATDTEERLESMTARPEWLRRR